MATSTWTGATSVKWGESDNWDGSVPAEDDTVVIGASARWPPSPPRGTRVKRLEMTGGAIEDVLVVTESFQWSGGTHVGVELPPGAEVNIFGPSPKGMSGELSIGRGTVVAATVDCSVGAKVTVNGKLTVIGDSAFVWEGGGSNPRLTVPGTLEVASGTLTVGDMLFRATGTLDISPGATLSIQGFTQPAVLAGGCRLLGGRLCVEKEGRLFVESTVRMAPGAVLELKEGRLENRHAGRIAQGIIGPVEDQHLFVDGELLWTGGAIVGRVTVLPGGLLRSSGSGVRTFADGVVTVQGAAELGAGEHVTDNGRLVVSGELRMRAGARLGSGRTFRLINRGTISVDEAGTAEIGDLPVRNDGLIRVARGTLAMHHVGRTFEQGAKGQLQVGNGATLADDSPLVLKAGRLEGGGRINADVIQSGVTEPSDDGRPGTLAVTGFYSQTKTGVLRLKVAAVRGRPGASCLTVAGDVTMSGRLVVDVDNPNMGDGDAVLVVKGKLINGQFDRTTGVKLDDNKALDQEWASDRLRLVASPRATTLVFYGFSGDGPAPSWPDGADRNQQMKLTAETIASCVRGQYPADQVLVRQAWFKDRIIEEIVRAPRPVRQVHVVTHGTAVGLFLAFNFRDGARVKAAAQKWNNAPGTPLARAKAAILSEDALIPPVLDYVDPATRTALRSMHRRDASWQIWGCRAGFERALFTGDDDPAIDAYQRRFNLLGSGNPLSLPGVARHIAMALGVNVTAVRGQDEQGLNFFRALSRDQVLAAGDSDPARQPYFLWLTRWARWVTWQPDGSEAVAVEMLGRRRGSGDLMPGPPPEWLVAQYDW